MGNRITAQLTIVTVQQLAAALEFAWEKMLGARPKREALCVLLAQSALETGHWRKCYCFNLGNAKASELWKGDHCFYAADEIVTEAQAARAYAARAPRTDGVEGLNVELKRLESGKVQVLLHPDHPWCRFRAFTTLALGAEDYLGLLNNRFHAAWPAVEAGDVEGFVRKLSALGYFTASVERYLPPVLKLFTQFLHTLPASKALRPSLRLGAEGPFVSEAQQLLISMGSEGLTQSGIFDEPMLQAVKLFQQQHTDERGQPLKPDGEVGPRTWWSLLNSSGKA